MRALLVYAGRDVRRRPGRAALAFLGVVIGVAAMVAISLATRAARDAYRDMYASLGGRAQLEVVAEGLGGFEEAVGVGLERVKGVRAVVPTIVGPAALSSPGPRAAVVVLGIDPVRDAAARTIEIVEGSGLSKADGAVLLASFARAQGVGVGGTIRLLTLAGPVELPVVGLAGPAALSAFPGGVVLVRLAVAQRLFGLAGRLNTAQLVLEEGASVDDVERAVRAGLPDGLRVERPSARGLLAESSLRASELGLSAVSLMSLVAAVFVILNAFSMNLAERRRDLATMRALGATRRQVASALAAEAAILGVSGTVVGIALGILAARGLALGIETMLGVPLPSPRISWPPILLALVVGPATTLAATILPARRASRRDPLRDLLGATDDAGEPIRRVVGLVGLAMVAGMVALTLGLARGALPSILIAPTMALGLLGAALAFPAALPFLRRAVLAILAPVSGPAGGLGLRQTARRPVHTSLSATVLFIAVVAGVGMGHEILGGVDDVREWSRRALTEDFFVRASMPDAGSLAVASIPESIGAEIEAMPSVAQVNRFRLIPAYVGSVPIVVIAHTFEPGKPLALVLRTTAGSEPPRTIGPQETIIGTALGHALRVDAGGEIVLSTRGGPRRFLVIATTTEYTAGGHAAYLSWEAAEAAFGAAGADAFMVIAKSGRVAEAGKSLEALAARDGLLLQSKAEFHAVVDGMVSGVVGLMWMALAVVFLVASLGIVNALTTNVLEQTRSIGVLRAVGMTQGQVRRMVVAQALAMAAMSLPPGALAGIALSRLMNSAVEPVRGFPIEFHLAPGLVLGCVGVALAVAALAAAVPAWRASRLLVTEALRYE